MSPINILNICSDIGNIGDDASHVGLQNILQQVLPKHNITKLDIRDFYYSEPARSKKYFDTELAQVINNYDLCIIGGGAYLDYPVTGSENGPTIDLNDGFLSELNTKTLISSVSCRPKLHDLKSQEKISRYLQKLQDNDNIAILLRNDGSLKHLQDAGIPTQGISEILDHGFFLQKDTTNDTCSIKGMDYCCLNLVHDQLSFYGNNKYFSKHNYHEYIRDLILEISKNHFEKIVLVPHIYQDLISITDILGKLPRKIINENIVIHQCAQGQQNAMTAFGSYNNSAVNIGTRFHTNVCSFSLERPTIPLALTGRIEALCDDLNVHYDLDDVISKFSSALDKSRIAASQLVPSLIGKKKVDTIATYREMLRDYL